MKSDNYIKFEEFEEQIKFLKSEIERLKINISQIQNNLLRAKNEELKKKHKINLRTESNCYIY